MRRSSSFLALVLALLLGITGTAHAAGPTWLPAQTIEPSQASISGLSCPSATTCLAASSVPVVQDGGLSYEPDPDPDPSSTLNAVSCAPGTRFCVFVDNNGGAFTYSGGSFGALQDIDGDVELDSVSCPSTTLCMAIDHNNELFEYSNGAWDNGTPLPVPNAYTFANFVSVSCVSNAFCLALASTDAGELYYTWNGASWSSASSPFDVDGNHTVSLSCTSTTFCLETDDTGYASTFNGSGWSVPVHVDSFNSNPGLYSACVGMSCVAVDYYDNFFHSDDGTTWSTAVDIHGSTLISGIESLACATATLCVAGDGVGDATTYAVPPAAGKPALTGTPTVGHPLKLTHASVQTPSVWYHDDWRRCQNPDATCTQSPVSTSTQSYTLATADAGHYIDAREIIGFGFDEEGPTVSNIVGPISSGTVKAGTAKLSGKVSTTRAGVVTVPLRCTGGPCHGTLKLTTSTTIGSTRYSIAAGSTTQIKITLNAAGKQQLKQHNGRLNVTLAITPNSGSSTRIAIKLNDNQ